MRSILVLLALLSVATLFARRGYAAFVAHIVSAPLLLGIGVLIAPRNLAFLTPSMVASFEPAMRVGCAWIVLVVAMRGAPPSLAFLSSRDALIATVAGAFTWLSLSSLAFAFLWGAAHYGLGFAALKGELWATAGAALLVGGVVSTTGLAFAQEALQGRELKPAHRRLLLLTRHDEIAPAIAVCLAVWLWPVDVAAAPLYAIPWSAALAVVGLGLALALCQLLLGTSRTSSAASFIALLGLITYATGLSNSMLLPGAAVAFFLGGTLALAGQGQRILDAGVARSERPVRLAMLVLIGASLGFHGAAIAVGVALALARLVVKAAARALLSGSTKSGIPLSALLGSAGATMPFIASFALARPEPLLASEALTAVASCLALTDLMTLLAWRRAMADGEAVAKISAESA